MMIKLDQDGQQLVAQHAIGSGFQSVLFVDLRSAEDARRCVRIVRPETPEDGGVHGVATRRMTYMGYGGGQDYVQALRDVVLVVMIEKKEAVEHLDEILDVPGIDMVQWGPSDYSMSTGHAGERGNPEVRAAEKKVFETCLAKGIPPRAEIGSPGGRQALPGHGRAPLLPGHGHRRPLSGPAQARRGDARAAEVSRRRWAAAAWRGRPGRTRPAARSGWPAGGRGR